jgi:type III secretion system chaperone SycN
MNWVESTLLEFGRQSGIEQLNFGEHGVAQLVFESGSVLAVEMSQRSGLDEEVLVYLGRVVGFSAHNVVRSALERVHLSQAGAHSIQACLAGEGAQTMLLAIVRMPARLFTLQELHQTFDALRTWHDQLNS